jgi:hypothetical protein
MAALPLAFEANLCSIKSNLEEGYLLKAIFNYDGFVLVQADLNFMIGKTIEAESGTLCMVQLDIILLQDFLFIVKVRYLLALHKSVCISKRFQLGLSEAYLSERMTTFIGLLK